MKEFFHGWRRKAGLLTLFVACLFMAIWVRSLLVLDRFCLPQPDRMILTLDGACRWLSYTPLADSDFTPGKPSRFKWISSELTEEGRNNYDAFFMLSGGNIHWRWHWGGFDFGAVSETIQMPPKRYEIRQIPYWSVVLPLTLLSAYLILWKPRK